MITDRDESSGVGRHRYHYTRVVETHGYLVRIRVERDTYQEQSCAVAEILADNKTWTHIADDAPANWIHDTPPPSVLVHAATELDTIAEQLAQRAAAILAPTTNPRMSTGPNNQVRPGEMHNVRFI